MTLPKPGFIPTAKLVIEEVRPAPLIAADVERSISRHRQFQPADDDVDLRPWFQTLADLPAPPIDWRAFFGNDQPVELEVGSGRGLFLVTAGTRQPLRNFLGIECDFKEARRAAERIRKRGLPNVRLLGADARLVLAEYVVAGSLSALHVYFPDPWWKRRHHKRRLFTPSFLDQVARVLEPGGLLHAWTDVAEYFTMMVELLAKHPAFERLPDPAEEAPENDLDYRTSFERKKRKAGLKINRGVWRIRDCRSVTASAASKPGGR
ncbi:MAG: tRNA (guanosine(46)-N7)-methyltransferase TrmB [Planctomycetaceae bacterium]|nr:MAG: tRNA (guanosine(46)-N7)-methyltransferase TrmB [Planctomycetaceae bacterium]